MAKLGWRRWEARDAERDGGAHVWGRLIGDTGWRWPSREAEREMESQPNRMSGGTELDTSRAIGPSGMAVTGTSIADAGLPSLKMS